MGKLLELDGLIGSTTRLKENEDPIAPSAGNAEEEAEEQEFEFRLFSAPSKTIDTPTPTQNQRKGDGLNKGSESANKDGATQKLRIRVRSPTPNRDPAEGRFVRAFRGWQYYFTAPSLLEIEGKTEDEEIQAEKRRQFEDVSVTGEQLALWAKSQAWVCPLSRNEYLKNHY